MVLRALILVVWAVVSTACTGCSAATPSQADAATLRIWPVEATSSVPIFADATPPVSVESELQVSAARGETTSASFVVRANTADVPAINFEVTALSADDGATMIDPDQVDVRYVKVWYQAAGAWRQQRIRSNRKRELVPELLLKNPNLVQVNTETRRNLLLTSGADRGRYRDAASNTIHKAQWAQPRAAGVVPDAETLQSMVLTKRQSQQMWLNIRVPDSARGGTYRGDIRVVDLQGRVLAVMPLRLVVHDFVLAPTPLLYGVYYRGQLAPGTTTVSSELKTAAQLEIELTDIVDHGMNYAMVYQGNSNPLSKSSLASLRTPALREAYMDIYDRAGFARDRLFLLGRGSGSAAQRPQRTRKELDWYRARGYQKIYYYGRDEAAGDALKAQYSQWRTLRELGARVAAANNKHDLLETGMADVLDVAILARELRPDEARALRQRGVEAVLSYNRPQSAVENPAAYRRHYGFDLIGAGYDGAMVYAYQHGFGSIWDDLDHTRFRDHCLTYPTTRGVVSTLAWEGMREAVNDARYMATLEQAIAELPDNTPQRARLEQAMAELRADLQAFRTADPATLRARIARLVTDALGGSGQ